MKRRDFLKSAAITPAAAAIVSISDVAEAQSTSSTSAQTSASSGSASASSGSKETPDYAKHIVTTDMNGVGPDGKPLGQSATFSGASKAGATADTATGKMKLTDEEQAVLDGKEGEEKAKLMKIMVKFGETFGATEMVKLGGAPHSNLYTGAGYMAAMLDMLEQCAKAGLKSYAPYTVNPRPYDVYNVQNDAKAMQLIYDVYTEQTRMDWIHSMLGAPDLNLRSCACYLKEVGNAPEPGTPVAWCESSAVNYGNSVLGIRTNRYGGGMELICAMLGVAPVFGLMTDEGRQAKWLVDVKTSEEPDWGVLGTAIGRKCIEDIPFIAGVEDYFGGEVTEDNMHKLKAMGSATAAAGAVGCYHVEGVTPEPKEKGRDMLVEGYETYVYDDKEQQAVIDTFENLWEEKEGDPNVCYIGCPHNTYPEVLRWTTKITEALDAAGKEKTAVPVYLFMPATLRQSFLLNEPELAAKALGSGISATNMCAVTYTGMKGYRERFRGVTNSAKTRTYSNLRYFPEQKLIDIIVTGKV